MGLPHRSYYRNHLGFYRKVGTRFPREMANHLEREEVRFLGQMGLPTTRSSFLVRPCCLLARSFDLDRWVAIRPYHLRKATDDPKGGNNLSYATQGIYISFIFMHYLRRHYSSWWQKYNYLLEAGFDLGVAISGIIQVLIFAFGNNSKGIKIKWWGNTVGYAGVDYASYNQKAALLPIPAKGYFGLDPDQYPMDF